VCSNEASFRTTVTLLCPFAPPHLAPQVPPIRSQSMRTHGWSSLVAWLRNSFAQLGVGKSHGRRCASTYRPPVRSFQRHRLSGSATLSGIGSVPKGLDVNLPGSGRLASEDQSDPREIVGSGILVDEEDSVPGLAGHPWFGRRRAPVEAHSLDPFPRRKTDIWVDGSRMTRPSACLVQAHWVRSAAAIDL